MQIVWNEDKSVGILVKDDQLAYELRKGSANTLGIVSPEFMDAWAEMTAADVCTIEEVEFTYVRSA